jgi:hypothetical protein
MPETLGEWKSVPLEESLSREVEHFGRLPHE